MATRTATLLSPRAGSVIALLVFGLVVLSPFFRPSGREIPVHSIVHWDTRDYHYPTLLYISDAVRHGRQLPLWNPFAFLGHPLFADPQTQLWSPLLWLIVSTVGYSILMVQAQLVLMILLGGTGAWAAARTLGYRPVVALLAGASYMFCGYMVGHAGHLGSLSSLCYFPWAFACIIRFLRTGKASLAWMAMAGLLLAQCSVGGYAPVAFIGGLNLCAVLLLWPRRFPADRQPMRRLLGLLLMGGTALAVMAPQILGIVWGRRFFAYMQSGNFPLETASQLNALLARNVFTFLVPGITTIGANQGFRSNDVTMVNCYIGLGALWGIAVAIASRWRWHRVGLPFCLGLANLILAMGAAFSPRKLLYFLAPYMSIPHHPSLDFRGYAMFFGILTACAGWSAVLAAQRSGHPRSAGWIRGLLRAAVVILIVGAGALLYGWSLEKRSDVPKVETVGGFVPVPVCVGEEIVIQAIMLAILAGLVAFGRRRSFAPVLLVAFVILDMSSATYRCWSLVADKADRTTWSDVLGKERGRPRPLAPEQFLRYDDTPQSNAGMVRRMVSLVAYNPVRLLPREQFPNRTAFAARFGSLLESRVAILDTDGSATITALRPNGLELAAECQGAGKVRVLASWTSGWWYRIGRNTPIKLPPSNDGPSFMDIPVPAGQSQVELFFSPRYVLLSITVMLAAYIAALIYCAGALRRRRDN